MDSHGQSGRDVQLVPCHASYGVAHSRSATAAGSFSSESHNRCVFLPRGRTPSQCNRFKACEEVERELAAGDTPTAGPGQDAPTRCCGDSRCDVQPTAGQDLQVDRKRDAAPRVPPRLQPVRAPHAHMSAKEAVVAAKQRLDWAQAGLDAARATVKQQVLCSVGCPSDFAVSFHPFGAACAAPDLPPLLPLAQGMVYRTSEDVPRLHKRETTLVYATGCEGAAPCKDCTRDRTLPLCSRGVRRAAGRSHLGRRASWCS